MTERRDPVPPGPTLIGIGAQKCASSWLHTALGAHPQIGISDPKELNFFSYYYDHGARWYRQFFLPHVSKPIRAEVSPSYFHDPRAPERAHAFDPELRVVVLLRDPLERAFSNHLHEIIQAHIPLSHFAEGWDNNPAYHEQSLYARHLRLWLDAFPRAQIHVILSDEISADPVAVAEGLYRFAGADPGPASPVLTERRNVSDLPRWPWLRKALQCGGAGLRRLGLEPQLARLKAAAPVARLLSANSHDLRDLVPHIDPETRARFDAAMAEDLEQLCQLLGRTSLPWPSWERLQQ